MAWQTEMRPASFRDVAFHVATGERAGGRNVVVHRFPFSEAPPYTEDTGLKGRTYAVEGYVIGDDYLERLDALLRALEQPGTGQLSHPYFGVRTVAVESVRVRQSSQEGGMATLAMEFVESSATPPSPAATIDTLAQAASAIAAMKAAASGVFAAAAIAAGVTDSAAPAFGAVDAVLNRFANSMQAALRGAAVAPAARAAFERALTAPTVFPSQFAVAADYFPAWLESLFVAAAGALLADDAFVADPVGVVLSLYDVVELSSEASDEEIATFEATRLLAQRFALASSAGAVLTRDFESYDDAVDGRGSVIDAIDAHIADSTDDTYAQLVDLRIAVAAAVPGVDSSLPRLQLHTPPLTVPSLVLAHRLYGDVDDESAVVTRNKVRHPAFVPGGRELEVLTRE